MVRVAVIGAGVNGLASAVKIKLNNPEFDVTIIADKFTPETTGDGSGGLWYPFLAGNTPEDLIAKWGIETYSYLHQLWLEGTHNISLMPFYSLTRQARGTKIPSWANGVFGFHLLDDKELEYLSKLYSSKFVEGHTFMTLIVPPNCLLPYLFAQHISMGSKIVKQKVSSLQDYVLKDFDVVVNCSGLGARELVPDDKVFPIRGQVIKVKANWITATVIDEDEGHYIIPNYETCVLGGTHQENDYNTQPDNRDTDFILAGCRRLVPGLKNAKIVENWAGLRPGRHEVRLEGELINGKLYIHNYGHGGSGLTLFWGCATQVVRILQRQLAQINTTNYVSKL